MESYDSKNIFKDPGPTITPLFITNLVYAAETPTHPGSLALPTPTTYTTVPYPPSMTSPASLTPRTSIPSPRVIYHGNHHKRHAENDGWEVFSPWGSRRELVGRGSGVWLSRQGLREARKFMVHIFGSLSSFYTVSREGSSRDMAGMT